MSYKDQAQVLLFAHLTNFNYHSLQVSSNQTMGEVKSIILLQQHNFLLAVDQYHPLLTLIFLGNSQAKLQIQLWSEMSNRGMTSLLNIPENSLSQVALKDDVERLTIMHSNNLTDMKGVEKLRKLTILNLSCNSLMKIQGLDSLPLLKKLDLSTNKLKALDGLNNIVSVEVLLVSNNQIESLAGLIPLSKREAHLKVFEARNNRLASLDDIQILGRFSKLEEIVFDSKIGNPFCMDKARYFAEIYRLANFHKLKRIDNQDPRQIQSFCLQASSLSQSIAKQNRNTANHTVINQPTVIQHPTPYGGSREIISQQFDIERLLSYKEKMLGELEQRNSKLQVQSNQRYKQLVKREHQVEKLYSQIQEIQKRMYEKDQQLQAGQKQTSEAIRENAKLSRDLANKNTEIERHLTNIADLRQELGETKAVLKDTDRRLTELNSKVLDNVNHTTLRGEELKRKYSAIAQELKASSRQNTQMKQRILQLTELCREWQFKYERKLDELSHEHEKEKNQLVSDYEKKLGEIEHYYKEIIQGRHVQYKQQLDLVEEEFKAALKDVSEKYKAAKAGLDEKNRQEADSRSLLKTTLQKNADQQSLIQQLQSVLLKFRQQVSDIIKEKQQLNAEINSIRNNKTQQVRQLTEEKDRAYYEKQYLDRQYSQLKQKYNNLQLEHQRTLGKSKVATDLEVQIEHLTLEVSTKNHMLQDKNETIQSLKGDLNNIRMQLEEKNNDTSSTRKKYEKAKQNLKEMEGQIQNFAAQNDALKERQAELQAQIQQWRNKIQSKEENQAKIQKYLNQFEENVKEKDQQIAQLLDLLETCKKVNQTKNSEIEAAKIEADKIRKQFEEKFKFSKARERTLKGQVDELKQKLSQLEADKKAIIQENERSKRQAKQNLQRLSKMFQ